MKSCEQTSAPLGDVVTAVFDQAERNSGNHAEVARLASSAVMRFWLRSTQALAARPFPQVVRRGLR